MSQLPSWPFVTSSVNKCTSVLSFSVQGESDKNWVELWLWLVKCQQFFMSNFNLMCDQIMGVVLTQTLPSENDIIVQQLKCLLPWTSAYGSDHGVRWSCYLVLLSTDSNTRLQDSCTFMTQPICRGHTGWQTTLTAASDENFVKMTFLFPCWTCCQWGITGEREIKFIGLFGDRGHRGPYSPYKPGNHNLYIGIIIFPHIDNPQSTGYN